MKKVKEAKKELTEDEMDTLNYLGMLL